jgi:hypothetical protein
MLRIGSDVGDDPVTSESDVGLAKRKSVEIFNQARDMQFIYDVLRRRFLQQYIT